MDLVHLTEQRSIIPQTMILCVTLMLAACATATIPAPTASPSATWTATPPPSETATLYPTLAPASATLTRTSTPKPTASATPHRTPTATATANPTAGPSPTPSAAQVCATLATKGSIGIFVVYIHPVPDLVWDTVPRQFLVGLCDTIPPPSVPQGKYKIVLSFPAGRGSLSESSVSRAELKPGLNEISVGPWIPGFENHLAICAQRAVAEIQVMYNDTPEPFFHVLLWSDGSDRVALPIQCGGNFA
jgi:hypothetical protein